jgi:hypothetical protein
MPIWRAILRKRQQGKPDLQTKVFRRVETLLIEAILKEPAYTTMP